MPKPSRSLLHGDWLGSDTSSASITPASTNLVARPVAPTPTTSSPTPPELSITLTDLARDAKAQLGSYQIFRPLHFKLHTSRSQQPRIRVHRAPRSLTISIDHRLLFTASTSPASYHRLLDKIVYRTIKHSLFLPFPFSDQPAIYGPLFYVLLLLLSVPLLVLNGATNSFLGFLALVSPFALLLPAPAVAQWYDHLNHKREERTCRQLLRRYDEPTTRKFLALNSSYLHRLSLNQYLAGQKQAQAEKHARRQAKIARHQAKDVKGVRI